MKKSKAPSLNSEEVLNRMMNAVNGVSITANDSWKFFEAILDKHTRLSNKKMKVLIKQLPETEDGFVDFKNIAGKRRRVNFFRRMKKIYDEWHLGIVRDSGIYIPSKKSKSWDISLGLIKFKTGDILFRIRDEVIRRVNELISTLDDQDLMSELIEESVRSNKKRKKTKTTGGVISARITGRGLTKKHKSHSRTTQIILRGLKGVIGDQEKALLENTLRGLDALPRSHANMMFDAASGLTLKEALNKVADDFSTNKINKNQLRMSIQTHIRAMVRRVATESAELSDITGVEHFAMIPSTRKEDLDREVSDQTQKDGFTILTKKELSKKSKGSGNSLGSHPGDKIIPVPIKKSKLFLFQKALGKARKKWLGKISKKKISRRKKR